MQQCSHCGYIRWPPVVSRPDCLAEGGTWMTVSGRGTIWSFAVYLEPLHPAFEGHCPYAVGLIELEEGPVVYAAPGGPTGQPGLRRAGRSVLLRARTRDERRALPVGYPRMIHIERFARLAREDREAEGEVGTAHSACAYRSQGQSGRCDRRGRSCDRSGAGCRGGGSGSSPCPSHFGKRRSWPRLLTLPPR